MQQEALQEWWWAVQKKNEDVHQYALRLTSIYYRLKNTPTRQQRIDRLQTGVVAEIRNEERRFIEPESDQWDDWVAFYNRIEKSLPSRATNLRRAKKLVPGGNQYSQGSSGRPNRGRRPPGAPQKAPGGNAWNSKKALTGFKRDRDGKPKCCFVCGKSDHIAKDCYKKAATAAATSEEAKK